MKPRIAPEVFEEALRVTGCTSYHEFGWKYLDLSGQTVRNYYDGTTVPPIKVAVILARLTRRRIEDLFIPASIDAA